MATRRRSSTTGGGPDAPIKKPRMDEQSSPFTDAELDQWLSDNASYVDVWNRIWQLDIRLALLVQAVDEHKPGALKPEYGHTHKAKALLEREPHIETLLQAGDYKGVLQSG